MPFEARLTQGNNHAAIRVRDLSGLESFYQEALGLKVVSRRRGVAGVPDATFFVGLQLLHVPDQDITAKGVFDHAGINVGNMDEIIAHLASRGVGLVGSINAPNPGVRTAFVHDPEGNAIELIEREGAPPL